MNCNIPICGIKIVDFQKRVYLFQKDFELYQQNIFIILVKNNL